MTGPPMLLDATKPNLTRTLEELHIGDGSRLTVTDKALSYPLDVIIKFAP